MPSAISPVTDWLARMFWMLADEVNASPIVGLNAKKSTMSTRKIGTAERSTSPPSWRIAGGFLFVPSSAATMTAEVSDIPALTLRVDELIQMVCAEIVARHLGDQSAVAEDDRAVDDLGQFLEIRSDQDGRPAPSGHLTDRCVDVGTRT